MRIGVLVLLLAGLAPAPEKPRGFIQAVEFPYYAYPPQLWERELVWLKNLGIDTVAFSIPWNWHREDAETLDLTGRTSPRRDLVGFIRLVKRAGLQAWIRPLPPIHGWINSGYPAGLESNRRELRKWLWDLSDALGPFLASHGGPIAFVEGCPGVFDVPEPPLPVTVVFAKAPRAFIQSRQVFAAGHGSLLWEEVEDLLPPVGWEAGGGSVFRAGAVSMAGDERTPLTPLRRDAALWRYWGAALPTMTPVPPVRLAAGKMPSGVSAQQLVAPSRASALSVINQSKNEFSGAFRVLDPPTHRNMTLPQIQIASGEALWLPIDIPLAGEGFCRDCSGFGNRDHIVYATAELNAVEFENGVLAMEFSAPHPGEVVLQLTQEPSGPLLTAGHPASFDWDDKTLRARLPIPQGTGPTHRVRIGIAIQPPDSSAFFVDAKRFTIGQQNRLETSYSSAELAQRSRLLIPQSFHAASDVKSPTEIEYQIDVPADSLHGEWTPLALEADGVMMSRARVQLLRPASVRIREAVSLQYGSDGELPIAPALVPVDASAGREVSLVIHNNSPEIRNFVVEAKGDGLEFSPPTEIAIGGGLERDALIRVFPVSSRSGLIPWRVHISGGADLDLPARFAVIPRGAALAYSADVDNDGQPEWVLENQHTRAVFSAHDGGRCLEFVWKDSGINVLPESGALAGKGVADVQITPDGALEFQAHGWKRTVRLAGSGASLTIEQTTPLPAEALPTGKTGNIVFRVTRESATHAVYGIERLAQ
jgi:Glycosyl hydrolases family 35